MPFSSVLALYLCSAPLGHPLAHQILISLSFPHPLVDVPSALDEAYLNAAAEAATLIPEKSRHLGASSGSTTGPLSSSTAATGSSSAEGSTVGEHRNSTIYLTSSGDVFAAYGGGSKGRPVGFLDDWWECFMGR